MEEKKIKDTLQQQMTTEYQLYDLAELFKVFGDSTRIKILSALLSGERNVGDLAEELNLTQTACSHQLRVLKNNKLVRSRRDGKAIYYSLSDDHVKAILEIGMEHILE